MDVITDDDLSQKIHINRIIEKQKLLTNTNVAYNSMDEGMLKEIPVSSVLAKLEYGTAV